MQLFFLIGVKHVHHFILKKSEVDFVMTFTP